MRAEPAAAARLTLRLLGLAAWRVDGGPWWPLARKDAALLARLALQGRQARTELAAWLWPDVALPRAHANLRQRLFRQRQQAGGLVNEDGEGLWLGPQVVCDLGASGPGDDADLAAALLAGLPDADDAVQRWLDTARQVWAVQRLDALAARATRQQARGELAAALASTETLLALDPLLEHAWRRLMRLHHQRGDRAAAVATFERCERVLRDELGLKPSGETQALLAQVEAGAPEPLPLHAPLPPSLLRPPQLVARQAELALMAATWQARDSFAVVAEAGLGKSRLLAEFAAQRPAVLLVSARAGDASVTYGALLRLLRRLPSAVAQADRLWPDGAARAELARLLPELGPAPPAPGLQGLLHAALDELFDRAADAGLAGLLVDDLQLADAASRHALLHAAAARGRLRWGFASRPDGTAPLAVAQTLALPALGPDAVARLLATLAEPALAGPGLALQSLAPRLAAHCGGNPLFLLETIKHLLLNPPARAADPLPLPLPASMQAALAQRLAYLSPAAQALARVAAVAGSDFQADLAAEVLQQPLLALADAWQELLAAQVLHDTGFTHETLRDAVLRGLPATLQGPLQRRLARALQRRGGAAAAVARHYAAAGAWASAAASSRRAAADARRLGRTPEQLQHLADAAAACTAAGQPDAAFEARIAALAPLLAAQGLDAVLAEALTLQPLATHPRQQCALHLACADAALGSYRSDTVLSAAAAALAAATPGSRQDLRARLLQAAGLALLGQVADATRLLAPLRPRVQAEANALLAAPLWSQVALVEHAGGQLAACVQSLENQQRLAHGAGDATIEVQARASLGALYIATGDALGGIEQAGAAAALHRRMGEPHAALLADTNLAIGLIGVDRLQPALALLQGMAAQLPASGDLARINRELQAEVWLRAGQPERALQALAQPPEADAVLVRQINWRLLQALAVQQGGDGAQAHSLWQALRLRLPAGRSVGVRLRAAVLASVVLPGTQAVAELGDWIDAATQGGMPAGAGLARLRRAAFAWRDGQMATALADVQWLLARRQQLQHLYLPGAELLATAWAVLAAAGQPHEAAALRAQAQRWYRDQVQADLPAACNSSWRAHPAHRGLF